MIEARRVCVRAGGRVVGDGAVAEVLTPQLLEAAYATPCEVLRGRSGMVFTSS